MRDLKRTLVLVLSMIAVCAHASDAGLRDPMKPFSKAAEIKRGQTMMVVNAIFVSDRRRLAIVNGQRVRVGESINGMRITDIQSDHVTLSRSGNSYTLHLGERSGF